MWLNPVQPMGSTSVIGKDYFRPGFFQSHSNKSHASEELKRLGPANDHCSCHAMFIRNTE